MSMAELKAKLSLDNSKFESGMRQAQDRARAFGSQMASSLGSVLAAGALVKMGSDAIQLGDRINDLSQKFNISAESLQRIGNAASVNGSDLEGVAAAMNKLAVNSQKALLGNKELAESFANAGISIDDLKTKNTEELFYQIADAIAEGKLEGKEFATVTELMGKSAGDLLVTLRMGGKAIRDIGGEMGVMSAETTEKLSAIDDQMAVMTKRFGIAFAEIVVGLKPVIMFAIELLERLATVMGGIPKFIAAHGMKGEEIKEVEKIGENLMALEKRQKEQNIAGMTKGEFLAARPSMSEEDQMLWMDNQKARQTKKAAEKSQLEREQEEKDAKEKEKRDKILRDAAEREAERRERIAERAARFNEQRSDEDRRARQERALDRARTPEERERLNKRFDAENDRARREREQRDYLNDIQKIQEDGKKDLLNLREKLGDAAPQSLEELDTTNKLLSSIDARLKDAILG